MTSAPLCVALMIGGALAALGDGAGASPKDDAVRRARERLARQVGTQQARVALQSVEEAEWPDASLGCPEKGMLYAQVLTSGYRVMLTWAGQEYEVHVAGTQAVICPSGKAAAKPSAETRAAEIRQVSASAQRDLATRLGLPAAEVKVTVVRDVSGKGKAGCSPPEPEDSSAPPAQAYELELRARDQTYRYLARDGRSTYCGPIG